MRSRSGAIHCHQSEDFLELAEAAHNLNGIFYDEKVNRKIMKQVNEKKNNKLNKVIQNNYDHINPEGQKYEEKDPFKFFDFTPEDVSKKQEKLELSKRNVECQRQIQVLILCSNLEKTRKSLMQALMIHEEKIQTKRQIDVIFFRAANIQYKVWIMTESQKKRYQSLFQIYKQKCFRNYYEQNNSLKRIPSKKANEWIEQLEFIENIKL